MSDELLNKLQQRIGRRGFLRGSGLAAVALAGAATFPGTAAAQDQKPSDKPATPEEPKKDDKPAETTKAPEQDKKADAEKEEDPFKVTKLDDKGKPFRVCPQCGFNMYRQDKTWSCDNCGYSYVE